MARYIEAGSSGSCAGCGDAIKFRARTKALQVICNVYVDDHWDRVEHYHQPCYDEAGRPYGDPDTSQLLRKRRAA